jgi:hypothetical protein
MNAFRICFPDPSDPDHDMCLDIPVLIDPVREIPDPKNLLAEVPEPVRADLAVLVAVDQLAVTVQDDSTRSYLGEVVEELTVRVRARLPDGATLTRTASG